MPNPTPRVRIGPVYAQCGTVKDTEGRDVLSGDWTHLLDPLSIDWGRTDVWTQPEPSVATVTVWQSDRHIEANPGYAWPKLVTQRQAQGQAFDVDIPRDGVAGYYTIFRGYISNVDMKRMTVRTVNGLEPGWAIRIQGSDRSATLAQCHTQGHTYIDLATMQLVADRLQAYGSGTGIREIYFESTYRTGAVNRIDTTDSTVYELVTDMYASFAHQFTYNPHRNVVIRIPSAYDHGSYSLQFGRTEVGGTVRLYAPRWVDNTGREAPIDSEPYPSAYIGGCDVIGDVVLSSDTVQATKDIICEWTIQPGNSKVLTRVEVPGPAAPNTVRYSSWFSDGLQIDPIVQDVKRKVLAEGARPPHPVIEWDTRRTHEVPDWNTFLSLTLPAQTVRMAVLAGSPYSAAMGVPPVWYPAGGTIVYSEGHWRFTINLNPAPLTLSGTPITFTSLANNSTGSTVTLGQLDGSISSYDMQYVTSATVSIWE